MSLAGLIGKGFGPTTSSDPPTAPTVAIADNANGTVTYTVTGGDSGSTHAAWYQDKNDGAPTEANTRVGNGTIVVTLASGFYWGWVVATASDMTAVSNLVEFRATDGTDAVLEQVLTAVRAAIQDMDLVDDANVVLLKNPDDRDTSIPAFPAIVIWPQGTEVIDGGQVVNLRTNVDYPVAVAIVAEDNWNQTSNRNTYFQWRQDLRRTFHKLVLSDVAENMWVDVEPRDIVVPSVWRERGAFVSGIMLRAKCREVGTL